MTWHQLNLFPPDPVPDKRPPLSVKLLDGSEIVCKPPRPVKAQPKKRENARGSAKTPSGSCGNATT